MEHLIYVSTSNGQFGLINDSGLHSIHPLFRCFRFLESQEDLPYSCHREVIKELLKTFPETIHCIDKLGDGPLDIAHLIMAETDTSFEEDASTFSRVEFTYKLLKKVSIDVYLKRKRQWEEDGYDTSKKDEPKIAPHSLGETSGETTGTSKSGISR